MSSHALGDVYQDLRAALKRYGCDNPDVEARMIIEHRSDFEFSDIIAFPEKVLDPKDYDQIMNDLKQRLSGMPLSRLYGEREFWGLPFSLSPQTLDPRPDTERLVEIALSRFSDSPPKHILDIGTGSGCILISLLSEFRDAFGVGVDLSLDAVETARQNALRNGVSRRSGFINGSWLDSVLVEKFDLIVSNPPYISNQIIESLSIEVRNHDPILALDGGETGLEPYKILFPKIKSALKRGGVALFEIGYDQADDVMRLSEIAGFALRRVHVDYSGNPRVVEISCGDK